MENTLPYQQGDFTPGKGHYFLCETCGQGFFGRANRKYCSSFCKNKQNNSRAKLRREETQEEEIILRKNYSILKDLYAYSLGEQLLPIGMLKNKGFVFTAPSRMVRFEETGETVYLYHTYGYSYDKETQTFKVFSKHELH